MVKGFIQTLPNTEALRLDAVRLLSGTRGLPGKFRIEAKDGLVVRIRSSPQQNAAAAGLSFTCREIGLLTRKSPAAGIQHRGPAVRIRWLDGGRSSFFDKIKKGFLRGRAEFMNMGILPLT
ncbi:hypothetical protein O9H85_14585 [Paenibacillus filicis]|uniref:Uncharacterized protein n=1 Tax=Paenibacillus gyeongsangnamensis TaxID=3388067 RepID=A0ABT4Q9T5_9BACL|nr:hypothetical protein [Paenibacillus filicis]MCZ8513641.1 hypothetical protein [Paenibacillus filicis]